jgi:hypothetical protein
MKAIIALFIFSLLLACGSNVNYVMQKGSTKITGNLSAYSVGELNALTKQVGILLVVNDSTLSATDKALLLSYLSTMKDMDVQVIEQRGGYEHYAGSRQQTRDMEIDAITRYQKSKMKKIKK